VIVRADGAGRYGRRDRVILSGAKDRVGGASVRSGSG
jgi:hypothetical protein